MFDSINLSKFLVPHKQKGFLHRARLVDWLHENSHRKLTFVSAPAGYGKTLMLVDFATDVDARVCWFLVTQGDVDLRRFAWDMMLSIRQSFPDFGHEIEAFLRTNQGALDPVTLAIDFINEALRAVDDFCMVFIDDYHLVAESDNVTGFFEMLLDYLPDGIRIILASRTEFGIPTAKLYARNEINLMNVDQLRFRPQELQELVLRTHRLKLSDADAEELARRSDGWIVAAMLAAQRLKQGKPLEFQGSTEYVYTFLAQEVIEREAEILQDFMLAICIVDEFNSEIAGSLGGNGNAGALIRELERRNLFISRVETGDGTAYRFHQLFLDFLRHRLAVVHPTRKQELHGLAASWYEEHRDWELAIQHYLLLGDRTSAARLMDYVAKHFFVSGENLRVEAWLDILKGPPDLRSASPELILNRAKYLVDQNQLSDAEQLLEIAEGVFETIGDTDKILNGLSVRGVILLRRRRYEEALEIVRRAKEILAGQIHGDLYVARPLQFDRIEALAHLWGRDKEDGILRLKQVIEGLRKLLDEVESRLTKVQIAHDLVLSLDTLGLLMYQAGKLYEGQNNFLDALSYRERYFRSDQGLVYSLNNIGFIYYQLGDLEKAYLYLQQALRIAETVEKGQATIHMYNSWADLLREVDEWEASEKNLLAAIKLGEDTSLFKKPLNNSGTYLAYVRLERARGNYDKAIYFLHESIRLGQQTPDSPEFLTNLGAIYCSMGQMDLAIDTLKKAVDKFNEGGRTSQEHATAAFLLGAAYFRKGEEAASQECLEQSFSMAASMGYDQFIISEGRREVDVVEFAARALPESGQVKSILKRVHAYQTGLGQFAAVDESVGEEAEPILLEVFGFGPGRVRINGELIKKSGWRANNARALFFFILETGGTSSPAIKLAFWPEKSGAKATSNFQSTLWRTRKALGELNVIVLENNRYRIVREARIWYDVDEFESRVKRAADESLPGSERIDLLKSAVDLYSGPYLEDIFMDWSDDRRHELLRLYREALEAIAQAAFSRGKYDEAVAYYDRLALDDPYRDDVQIAVMRCLMANGAPAKARARYDRYVRFLTEEGLDPSHELEAFERELTGVR